MSTKLSTKVRLGALAAAAAATIATTTAAPAEAGTTKVVHNVPGAYGALNNIYWPVDSVSRVYFDFVVVDTSADGDHAEARVQTKTPNGQVTSFAWHQAVGYLDRNEFSTYAQTSSPIAAVRIEVCRKGDDWPDICGYSDWAYQF